jgi:1-acyl-sn-glycerol-3-phosphate acyltransferase
MDARRQTARAKVPQGPAPNALGARLPASWLDALAARAHDRGPVALVADLFLDHPPDPRGFDPVLAKRMFFLLSQTVLRYFRVCVLDAEQIPPGRALLVGCHSGVFAWDATCLIVAVYQTTGRFTRNVGDRFFGTLGPMTDFLRRTGVVIGERESVEALLAQDELVLVYPGGADDMLRPIWRRYRLAPNHGLKPGHGGYVKAALRTRSPIVPIACVGTEEIHMMLGNVPALARLLGTPFFPIVASPLPLPARIYLRFGRPIQFAEPPEAADDQATVDHLNRLVQSELQALIDDTRRRRHGIYWSRYDVTP